MRLKAAQKFVSRFDGVVYVFAGLAQDGLESAKLAAVSRPSELEGLDAKGLWPSPEHRGGRIPPLPGRARESRAFDQQHSSQRRSRVLRAAKSNPFQTLSPRELEVALLLNKGKSLPDICTVLNIEYSTGNTYKRRILEKLMVPNVLSLSRLMQTFNFEG